MPSDFAAAGLKIARQCDIASANITGASAAGVRTAAGLVVGAVAGHLGGQSITLRGVGKKGARVAVVAVVLGGANPSAIVNMTGPAHLIERDTDPHVILGRKVGRLGKGKGSRSKEAKYAAKQQLYSALFGGEGGGPLKIADRWVTGPVNHPGTKGKHPFEKGVRDARPLAEKAYARGVSRAVRKGFST